MRKEVYSVLFLVFVIAMMSFALAAEVSPNATQTGNSSEIKKDSVDSAKGDIKNASSTFKQNSNEILEKELGMSPGVQNFFRMLFGFKSGEVMKFDLFIVCCCMIILMFLVIRQAVEMVPFTSKLSSLYGLIITLLASIGGAVKNLGTFLFSSMDFGILKDWVVLRVLFTIFIWIIIFAMFSIMMKSAKRKRELAEAEENGRAMVQGKKYAKIYQKGAERLAGKDEED